MDFLSYSTLKTIHVSAVVLSICGFTARGVGVLRGASWVRHRLTRTVPHIIDTVLLLAALDMLWTIRLSPWAVPWLLAKIIGLVFYIALGVIALRRARGEPTARPRPARLLVWLAAIGVFGYIVSVAITKDPLGFIVWW
jgi:uncharacterized membrane protein SirB2